ncbi:monovalent cation/H(+) antiporter subunit G [Microbulbifer yueqingensis]|uniref:Multisubunit sodium/proton antiporter, MrpG subunit n=1 Tax=Microbulbifer yueqingensis TaxID=658219 RepID=A0A1G8ZZM5_9GAMM|nr:monovalent cation/H(+) antiporter subunit G [Microbulbifer yueqingensis]SDK19600.1 multisubunit sodium/proton antiporter, MrpG subunit [Microbulbifer yueqingensis]
MIDSLLNALSGLMLAAGCFFMVSGAVGLVRFPDFYTRMHAAGVTDTLATFLIVGALMLLAGWSLALFKLGLILLFIFFTSPTASHALAKAAQHSELRLEQPGRPATAQAGQAARNAAEPALEADTTNTGRD